MNQPIKIKVCGMRDEDNIMQMAALRPDYMGFIFFPSSPRNVGNHFTLPENFPDTIKKVGVFVNDTTDTIKAAIERVGLQLVQLHGNEPVGTVKAVRRMGVQTIKVFSVDETFDFETTKPYQEDADYFLFDTKGKYHGGNGKAFTWELLQAYDQTVPFFLSGGLNTENIHEHSLLKDMNLHALDVNSGIESKPGMKDADKAAAFFAAVRNRKQ